MAARPLEAKSALWFSTSKTWWVGSLPSYQAPWPTQNPEIWRKHGKPWWNVEKTLQKTSWNWWEVNIMYTVNGRNTTNFKRYFGNDVEHIGKNALWFPRGGASWNIMSIFDGALGVLVMFSSACFWRFVHLWFDGYILYNMNKSVQGSSCLAWSSVWSISLELFDSRASSSSSSEPESESESKETTEPEPAKQSDQRNCKRPWSKEIRPAMIVLPRSQTKRRVKTSTWATLKPPNKDKQSNVQNVQRTKHDKTVSRRHLPPPNFCISSIPVLPCFTRSYPSLARLHRQALPRLDASPDRSSRLTALGTSTPQAQTFPRHVQSGQRWKEKKWLQWGKWNENEHCWLMLTSGVHKNLLSHLPGVMSQAHGGLREGKISSCIKDNTHTLHLDSESTPCLYPLVLNY